MPNTKQRIYRRVLFCYTIYKFRSYLLSSTRTVKNPLKSITFLQLFSNKIRHFFYIPQRGRKGLCGNDTNPSVLLVFSLCFETKRQSNSILITDNYHPHKYPIQYQNSTLALLLLDRLTAVSSLRLFWLLPLLM